MKLKLQEKLKKLLLNKYRYKVVTSIDNFNQKKYFGYNINIQDDNVVFYLNKLDSNIKNDEEVLVFDRFKNLFKYIFKTKIISTVSVICIIILFLFSNLFIREIRFSNEETYNYYVLEDVKKEIKSIGPFKKMNINLNDLSNQLRHKYYNYAYIGVRKVAGTIYIDIQLVDEYNHHLDKIDVPCDIIANVDGKIIGFEVQKGIPVVNINQIVKKGDLLVSGNINYQTNPNDFSNLVHAQGIVLIEYAQYEKINIPKKYSYDYIENNIKKNYTLEILDKVIGNNRIDDKSQKVIKHNVFQITKHLKLYQNSVYTITKKQSIMRFDEAKTLSLIKLYNNFINNLQSNSEKIKYLKFISSYETDKEYVFCYLVKYVSSNVINKYY